MRNRVIKKRSRCGGTQSVIKVNGNSQLTFTILPCQCDVHALMKHCPAKWKRWLKTRYSPAATHGDAPFNDIEMDILASSIVEKALRDSKEIKPKRR